MTLTPGPGDTLADAIGKVAHAYDATIPLNFLAHLADDDAYHRGDCLILLPGIWTGQPQALLDAMRQRRRASATGRCPVCSACIEPATGTWRHEPACIVADDNLRPLLTAWARHVGQYARGRRICEDPT